MPSVQVLPIPPDDLRQWVGPLTDPDTFRHSGQKMAADIVDLCRLSPTAQVLDVGCGCGRLALGLADVLSAEGRYVGIDLARVLIEWCRQNLEPLAPNFSFRFVDVRDDDRNTQGAVPPASFVFPFAANTFDVAVASSLITHMLSNEIENYLAQMHRVLKPGGACFLTAFLLDQEGEAAVANGDTIFDFRHPVGPCVTFDSKHPREGIACRPEWLFALLDRIGFRREAAVHRGDWRSMRSYVISQDYVIARKI